MCYSVLEAYGGPDDRRGREAIFWESVVKTTTILTEQVVGSEFNY